MDRATFLLEAVRENSFPCFVTASKGHHHSLFHDPLPPSSKPAMEHLIGPAPTVTPSSGFSSTFNDLCDRVSQVALVVKDTPANSGDIREAASIPGLRRSPGGRHGNPLQYSCLENPMDREAWWTMVYRVAKNWTQLSMSMCEHTGTTHISQDKFSILRTVD